MESRSPDVVAPQPGAMPVGAEPVVCDIRALATLGELVESYRLRYQVYGELGYLQRFNDSELEIDPYDLRSIAFGAFDTISGALIGTLRLITDELQPAYLRAIYGVLGACGDDALAAQALDDHPRRLPSIVSDAVARQIDALNGERREVRELSRAIVRPGHRGLGVSRGLIEAALAHLARRGPTVILGGCLPEHVAMYARFGCAPVPDTGLARFEAVGQIAHTVIGRTDALPAPTRGHVDELVRAMAAGAASCTIALGPRAIARHHLLPARARRHTRQS
jgi:GNAT superfamily N-acetyltransferase